MMQPSNPLVINLTYRIPVSVIFYQVVFITVSHVFIVSWKVMWFINTHSNSQLEAVFNPKQTCIPCGTSHVAACELKQHT